MINGTDRPGSRDLRCSALWLCGAFVLVSALAMPSVLPASGADQALTPEQEKFARSLDAKLIAPCCFQGTLAEHQSPKATELRAELRALVAKGASEEEVLDHFLGKYGERILAAPKVQGFNLLAYVMPVVGLAVGGVLILFLFRRATGARTAERPRVAPGGAPSTAFDDSLQARFKEELDRFER